MFGIDDTPIRFVADKTFFHDALRTEYPHPEDAEWLLFYAIVRHSIEPYERIFVVSSLVINKLQREFRSYPYIPPQIIQVIRKTTHIADFTGDVPIDHSTIYTMAWLSTKDTIPILISTVKEGKWLERIKTAGTILDVEGYSKVMSDKRVHQSFPGYIINIKQAREILKNHDTLFKDVSSLIKE